MNLEANLKASTEISLQHLGEEPRGEGEAEPTCEVSDPVEFVRWAEAEAHRIAGLPVEEQEATALRISAGHKTGRLEG